MSDETTWLTEVVFKTIPIDPGVAIVSLRILVCEAKTNVLIAIRKEAVVLSIWNLIL
jgi:hypothetical protein